MPALDPFTLDRRLASAASSWWGFRRALCGGTAADHRFEGDAAFASVELLQELEQAPGGVFSAAQRRWVFRLFEQRRHAGALQRVADAWWREPRPLDVPEAVELPLHGVLSRVLTAREDRAAWLRALAEHGGRLAAERLALWELRAELRETFGAERFDSLWRPGVALAAAPALLERTRDADLERAPRELSGLIEVLIGAGAGGSFPAHLSLRSLIELLDAARWFDGLRLEVSELPARLAPASFVRGLAAVGAAFVRALKNEQGAFSALRDPFGLGEHAHAALFAMLPLLPDFAQRRLGVPRHALGDFRRRAGAALVADARATALRALQLEPALRGGQAFRDGFSEAFSRAFGAECDPRLAGVLFMPRFDQAQRLGGLLLAACRFEELVRRHDEDWYRNPRAREELRESARLPDASALSDEDAQAGLEALERVAR